jgi:Flp pilus assembly protein TadG
VVVEFLMWAPVFAILTFAIIEFALILTAAQHLKMASRAGAKVAAELSTTALASPLDANNLTLVQTAVADVLSSAELTPCRVILEYNPTCGGISPGAKQVGACPNCTAPAAPLPGNIAIPGGTVRVTVCVRIDQMTPDMLSLFGFSIQDRIVRMSTLLPYENCN